MMDLKKIIKTLDSINEGSMAAAEKHPTGPKFPGYWKGTDPASLAKSRMVGSAEESKSNLLRDLSQTARETKLRRKLEDDFLNFKQDNKSNPTDSIKLDVPLLIRIMEYAREDAKDDMDLHRIAEKLVDLGKNGQTLTMNDYNDIVQQEVNEYGNAQNPNTQSTTPGKSGSSQADAENDADAKIGDAAMQTNIATLKTILPDLNIPQTTTAVQKTDVPGAKLTPAELEQTKKLSSLIEPALTDPKIGKQFTTLLRQADRQERVELAKKK